MMTPDQFINLVENPAQADSESLKQLEQTLHDYPYFQSAQILYAVSLLKENNPHFQTQLKKAAAYASDRRILKHLITKIRELQPEPEKPTLPLAGKISFPQRALPIQDLKKPEPSPAEAKLQPVVPLRSDPLPKVPVAAKSASMNMTREELLEIVKNRLKEIKLEKQEIARQKQPVISPPDDLKPYLSKEELIDRFIREEPGIIRPRHALVNPLNQAEHGNLADDELVSETLAILFYKQGHRDKAIHIYEKLHLQYPEKSSYFAAQIEKIKNGLAFDHPHDMANVDQS